MLSVGYLFVASHKQIRPENLNVCPPGGLSNSATNCPPASAVGFPANNKLPDGRDAFSGPLYSNAGLMYFLDNTGVSIYHGGNIALTGRMGQVFPASTQTIPTPTPWTTGPSPPLSVPRRICTIELRKGRIRCKMSAIDLWPTSLPTGRTRKSSGTCPLDGRPARLRDRSAELGDDGSGDADGLPVADRGGSVTYFLGATVVNCACDGAVPPGPVTVPGSGRRCRTSGLPWLAMLCRPWPGRRAGRCRRRR